MFTHNINHHIFSPPNIDNTFELFCLHCNKHGFVGHYNENVVKSSGLIQHIKSNLLCFCIIYIFSLTSIKSIKLLTSGSISFGSQNMPSSYDESSSDDNYKDFCKPRYFFICKYFWLIKKIMFTSKHGKIQHNIHIWKIYCSSIALQFMYRSTFIHIKIINHILQLLSRIILNKNKNNQSLVTCESNPNINTNNVDEVEDIDLSSDYKEEENKKKLVMLTCFQT